MANTAFTQTAKARSSGQYLIISYKCSRCQGVLNIPEQQGFRYCYLCGAKVTKILSADLTWNPLA